MGELERMGTNNTWIWIILAFLFLSNGCGVSGIFEELKCSTGGLFSGNNLIWIAAIFFLFYNNGMC